jgi:calcium-dependent protein kinase
VDKDIAQEAFTDMRSFLNASNLKKTTLTYLASKLPEKNIEELRTMFISLDLDGDGRLTAEEFSQGLNEYGFKYTDDEVKDIMYNVDTNANGFIDYTEFIAGCMKSKIYLNEDHLRAAF